MITTFYFLRHGDVHNPKQVLYGRLPRFPLSSEGKKKVLKSVDFFKREGVKYIYTSPLLRARQTAAILGIGLKIKPRISSLLTEVDLIFKGVSIEKYHKEIQATLYSKANLKAGQESIKAVGVRMKKLIKIIVTRHAGNKILVVSHGDPIMILKAVTSGAKFTFQYKKSNYLPTASWFTLEYKNKRYIWK